MWIEVGDQCSYPCSSNHEGAILIFGCWGQMALSSTLISQIELEYMILVPGIKWLWIMIMRQAWETGSTGSITITRLSWADTSRRYGRSLRLQSDWTYFSYNSTNLQYNHLPTCNCSTFLYHKRSRSHPIEPIPSRLRRKQPLRRIWWSGQRRWVPFLCCRLVSVLWCPPRLLLLEKIVASGQQCLPGSNLWYHGHRLCHRWHLLGKIGVVCHCIFIHHGLGRSVAKTLFETTAGVEQVVQRCFDYCRDRC